MTDLPLPPDSDLTDAEADELLLMCGHAPGPEPLSPAAQAVLDAANHTYDQAATVAQGTAAALRAVVAELSENLYDPSEGKVPVVCVEPLLAIADELEATS